MAAARPLVRILGSQANGLVRGVTDPSAAIEAVNASLSPGERVRPHESVVIARADAAGRFAGKLPLRDDDVVRVRARATSGAAGPWLTFRARGIEGPPRRPVVAVFRIGLRDLDDGTLEMFSLAPARPIAEPEAELVLTNARTGERVSVTTNARGALARRARIPGRAGDVLRVEARGTKVGTLAAPPACAPKGRPRPSHLHQRLGFVPDARRFDAPLFARRPCPFDVLQSELQNCYLASAAAAIAHVCPEALVDAIAPLGGARYRVRFKLGASYRPHDVVVSSELYVRPSGELLYGSSRGPLWWPILEKAFAAMRGGYHRVGTGGTSHRVLELLLGRPPRHFFIDPSMDADAVWSSLVAALEAKRPVVAGTSPPWTAKKYRGTGLVADHAYAVLGLREDRGRRWVTVRNPWGEDVRPPERVRRGGALEISIDELMRLFQVISTVR